MPELPEVETVCRGLSAALDGHRLVRVEQRRPDLRFPLPERFGERLTGRIVTGVRRRGKYILVVCDDDTVLLAHLGMSGRMVTAVPGVGPGPGSEAEAGAVPAAERPHPHDHIVFETAEGVRVTFRDARRFGFMDLTTQAALATHPRLVGLGPEPLAPAFTGAVLADRLAGRATTLKAALMDQATVAGLGNIYVSESLFRAGLSPLRLCRSVTAPQAGRLVRAIRAVLTEAIAAGGSSLRDYVQASGELGFFQHRFAVYGRAGQACPGCDCEPATTGGIRRLVLSNRSTFYCPRRQR